MADKIKIFELDIDVDSAIKSSSELKKQSNDLKTSLDALKKSGDTNSETYVRLEATYKNVNREYNASQRQIGKMIELQGKEITTVQQGRNALTILNKEWAKAANLYGENSKQADDLAKKHLDLKNRVNELQKGVGDTSGNIGNYTQSITEAVGKTTLFGHAQSLVKDVFGVVRPIYQVVKSDLLSIRQNYINATKGTAEFSTAQKATAIATNLTSGALKLLKVALISTGIGAIVVLLGSLVAWFSKTQAGIDFVNKALAGLGAGFDVIIDRASKLGGSLIKIISGDFAGAFNDMKDSLSEIGDEMQREITLAIQLEAELQKLERRQIATNVARSEINKLIKEQNKLAEDTTKTYDQRQKAINKAIELEQKQISIENSLANDQLKNALQLGGTYDENKNKIKEVRQAFIDAQGDTEVFQKTLLNIGISNTTVEDVKEIGDAIIENNRKIEASEEKLTTLGNKRNTINQSYENVRKANFKASQDRAKKAIDDAIKENRTRLKILEEQNKGQAKSLTEGVKIQEELRGKRLAILQEEVDAGKKTKAEAELEELKIKNEFLEKQTELTLQFAEQELQVFKSSHQSRLENNQLLTDELVEQEILRLETIANKEKEYQAKRLEEGVISQIDYNNAINQIDEENRAVKEELELERKEQKAEADAIDLENQRILEEERLAFDADLQLQYLEIQKQQELEIAEKKGADKSKIEAKYAKIEEQIQEAVQANKLALASDTFGNLINILGKESTAGKALAIAQTTIDTYQSATAAYKAMAGIPVVGPALGAIAAGSAIASGIANVKKITSTKKPDIPRAEQGALFEIGGKRHAQGGTKFYGEDGTVFEAEQGELIGVMNRNASSLFMNFNNQHRIGSNSIPNYFSDGGIVQRSIQNVSPRPQQAVKINPIDYDLLSETLTESIRQLPPPVTSVEDIIGQVRNYNEVVDGANI